MALVDERFSEHLYQKEDSSWKRCTEQKAKSLLNRELKSDLDDSSIPDDIKVKQHQQHLNRFLDTTRKLPAAEPEVFYRLSNPIGRRPVWVKLTDKEGKERKNTSLGRSKE